VNRLTPPNTELPLQLVVGAFVALGVVPIAQNLWPALLAVVLLLAAAVASVVSRRRFRRWLHQGSVCVVCGYDLRATPERCPECGTIPAS
jgi:hypothetical protein